MRANIILIPFFLAFSAVIAQKRYKYPITPKDSVVNIYFKTPVSDPYQWMENPNDPRLEEWLEAERKITNKEANSHTKEWTLRAQLATLYNDIENEKLEGYVEKDPSKIAKYEFDFVTNSDSRAPDFRYRKGKTGNYRMLIRSKDFRLSKDDNIDITSNYINEKYELTAIEISHNGGDWTEVYFFDLATGKQLPDTLKYLRTGSRVIWSGKDVFYDRYNPPKAGRELLDKATGQKLFYHKLGTRQSDDILLFENPDKTGTNSFDCLKIGDQLFLDHWYERNGQIFKAFSVSDINTNSFSFKNFLIYPNNVTLRIEKIFGDSVVLYTTWNSPHGRVLLANINEPNKLSEFIPEYDVILKSINRLGKDKIACVYRTEGQYLALIFNMSGELLKKIDFPEGKKVNYFFENSPDAEYTDFCLSSFYHPDLWYQLSLNDLTFKPSESVSVPYDASTLETRYVKYRSKDGTMIPMYITCLKETKLNGKNPTLLYGYGGYGITVEPSFDKNKALWLLHGGILAIPNIRGGGAEGEEWAKAGRRLNKQNAIDDFIGAAEYLIKEGYTNNQKLAINGSSHGGMLVGAAITQRPELFQAAIAEAGPFDMLRYENFGALLVNTNINEFGISTDSTDFYNLLSYSPLHNIKKGVKYPNVLLITGDQDDRVPPYHSYKFLATLQANEDPEYFSHLYVIPGAGHQGALTNDDWVAVLLHKYYFLFDQLGVRFY